MDELAVRDETGRPRERRGASALALAAWGLGGAALAAALALLFSDHSGGASSSASGPGLVAWRTALAAALPTLALVAIAVRLLSRRIEEAARGQAAARRDLELIRARLAESERAELAGRLAGALAHDLNNTLTLVIANAEWLTDRLVDHEAAEAATEIREAARNAASLTQQVLLASRAGMAQPRSLDLARATGAAAGALRRLLPPDIQVEARLDGPAWTHFDPGQLQQILLSLALNARAAMPGGGTLLLTVRGSSLAPAAGGDFPPRRSWRSPTPGSGSTSSSGGGRSSRSPAGWTSARPASGSPR